MQPIPFKEINSAHLVGKWQVNTRFLSKSDPDSIFAQGQEHHFLPDGTYKISNGAEIFGRWDITLPAEIIRNPLVRFNLAKETTNAIILRLMLSDDKKNAHLTLYLSSGLELILHKI